MIYACENKFFLYKCILLDGLLYFNPKIKITWRITGETGEVGLCIKISMPKGSTIPQYIFVCILCIFTYICEIALRVICTSPPAPLKCVLLERLLHVNAKMGVPDYPSLGI
jgi:hypothetical protein